VTSLSLLAANSVEKGHFEDVSNNIKLVQEALNLLKLYGSAITSITRHLFRGFGVISCSNPIVGLGGLENMEDMSG
jgi:hypothetical protein